MPTRQPEQVIGPTESQQTGCFQHPKNGTLILFANIRLDNDFPILIQEQISVEEFQTVVFTVTLSVYAVFIVVVLAACVVVEILRYLQCRLGSNSTILFRGFIVFFFLDATIRIIV